MTHCSDCGRQLIEVSERDGYDPTTGERRVRTWMQCPRFPRSWFMTLFRVGHDSFSRDNPIMAREWR